MCLGFGGSLVSTADDKEMEFVNTLSSRLKNNRAWIGLVHQFQNGGYLYGWIVELLIVLSSSIGSIANQVARSSNITYMC